MDFTAENGFHQDMRDIIMGSVSLAAICLSEIKYGVSKAELTVLEVQCT